MILKNTLFQIHITKGRQVRALPYQNLLRLARKAEHACSKTLTRIVALATRKL